MNIFILYSPGQGVIPTGQSFPHPPQLYTGVQENILYSTRTSHTRSTLLPFLLQSSTVYTIFFFAPTSPMSYVLSPPSPHPPLWYPIPHLPRWPLSHLAYHRVWSSTVYLLPFLSLLPWLLLLSLQFCPPLPPRPLSQLSLFIKLYTVVLLTYSLVYIPKVRESHVKHIRNRV